ncbi:MAG: hypothetical protein RR639_01620 [Hydrogenoanaerobacterium sp.]
MNWHNFERTKYFVLAFGASFLALLTLALCMAAFVNKEKPPVEELKAIPADEYYTPRREDSLNIMLAVCDDAGTPHSFFLVGINAMRGEIPVAVFTPQALVKSNEMMLTLGEVYTKNGAMAAKLALGEVLEITVHRSLSFTEENFINAIDIIGAVEYNFEELPYAAWDGENPVAGRQLLDGSRLYKLLCVGAAGVDSAELLAYYINSSLKNILRSDADEVFRKVINLADGDVSFNDYDSRRELLTFLSKLSGNHARSVMVRGVWNDKNVLQLSSSLSEIFGKMYG